MFRELFFLFFLCLGGFLSLLIVGKLLRMRDLFVVQGLSSLDLLQLFVYLSPFFLLLLLPVACMLCVFLTFLRMSTDREIIALRASGISLYRLLPGPVLFLLVCTAANLVIAFHGLSWGMDNFRSTVLEMARTKSELVLQPGVFNQDFPGLTIYARNVDRSTGTIEAVMVQDATTPEVTATIVSPEGRLVTDQETGSIVFSLRDGRIYRQAGEEAEILSFSRYRLTLDLSRLVEGFDLGEKRPREMSWDELGRLQRDPDLAQERGADFARTVQMERVKRVVLSVACLVLGLFAIPLASIFQGLRQHYGLILAMGCFMLYYSLLSVGLNLGEVGTVPPIIGLWTPNLVFLLLTALLMPYAVRQKSFSFIDRIRHAAGRSGTPRGQGQA
ncbi:MAG: LPS export ABC transporter permease LptF [Desulfohalobiaceae bacterium]